MFDYRAQIYYKERHNDPCFIKCHAESAWLQLFVLDCLPPNKLQSAGIQLVFGKIIHILHNFHLQCVSSYPRKLKFIQISIMQHSSHLPSLTYWCLVHAVYIHNQAPLQSTSYTSLLFLWSTTWDLLVIGCTTLKEQFKIWGNSLFCFFCKMKSAKLL